jgi:hypothetical protein
MREAGVFGRRKRKVGKPELTQAPKALHHRQIQQARLRPRELDEVVDRVEDPLHEKALSTPHPRRLEVPENRSGTRNLASCVSTNP